MACASCLYFYPCLRAKRVVRISRFQNEVLLRGCVPGTPCPNDPKSAPLTMPTRSTAVSRPMWVRVDFGALGRMVSSRQRHGRRAGRIYRRFGLNAYSTRPREAAPLTWPTSSQTQPRIQNLPDTSAQFLTDAALGQLCIPTFFGLLVTLGQCLSAGLFQQAAVERSRSAIKAMGICWLAAGQS